MTKKGFIRNILLATLLTVPQTMWAQQENQSPLQFDSYEWDFGTIEEKDGIVTHSFQYINVSRETVSIEGVSTSCGCTSANWSTAPIKPGETGEITVHFNPARTEGEMLRDVEVFTSLKGPATRLVLLINVIPMPMGLNELYPHQLSGNVKTNSARCNFGYIAQGTTQTKTVQIANIEKKNTKLTYRTTGNRNGMTVKVPDRLKGETVEAIEITYSIPVGSQSYGMARDTVWIMADGNEPVEKIVVSAIRIDAKTQNNNGPAPVMRIEPAYVDFGTKAAGKNYKQTITIENTGDADLVFFDVETTNGATSSLSDGFRIRPGRSEKVTMSINSDRKAGVTTIGSVNVTTNDPTRPFREIRLEVISK